MISTAQQLTTFVWMVATGIGIGIVFDFYRVFRGFVQPHWVVTALGDLFFGFIIFVWTYGVLLYVNYGEVRFFIFLGLVLGLFFYYRICSSFLIKYTLRIINIVNYCLSFLKGIFTMVVFRPFAFVLRISFYPVNVAYSCVKNFCINLRNLTVRNGVNLKDKIILGLRVILNPFTKKRK